MDSLDLATNLTGTMVYADFLSVFEPNLGILCVSLPMLGPIYARYIRRGPSSANSKLSGGHASSGALRTFGTSGQRKHYRLDDDTTCTVTVGGKGNDGSPQTSDVELNAIQVDREWVVETETRGR